MDTKGLCELIKQMSGVFGLLRTLAFVGAAFILANMAWDFIKGGGGKDSGGVMDQLKSKGLPMIIGFVLLFAVGIVLQFLIGGQFVECKDVIIGFGA